MKKKKIIPAGRGVCGRRNELMSRPIVLCTHIIEPSMMGSMNTCDVTWSCQGLNKMSSLTMSRSDAAYYANDLCIIVPLPWLLANKERTIHGIHILARTPSHSFAFFFSSNKQNKIGCGLFAYIFCYFFFLHSSLFAVKFFSRLLTSKVKC